MSEVPTNAPPNGRVPSGQANDASFRSALFNAISEDIAGNKDGELVATNRYRQHCFSNARTGAESAYINFLRRNFSRFEERTENQDKEAVLKFVIRKVNQSLDTLSAIEDAIAGSEDQSLVTAERMRLLYGLANVKAGQERAYIEYLKNEAGYGPQDNEKKFGRLTTDEKIEALQEAVDAVNLKAGVVGNREVLAKIEDRIAGIDDSTQFQAEDFNNIDGLSGAVAGNIPTYLEMLSRDFSQFRLRSEGHQIELLQFVIDAVNAKQGNLEEAPQADQNDEAGNDEAPPADQNDEAGNDDASPVDQNDEAGNDDASPVDQNDETGNGDAPPAGQSDETGNDETPPAGQNNEVGNDDNNEPANRDTDVVLKIIEDDVLNVQRQPIVTYTQFNSIVGVINAEKGLEKDYVKEIRSTPLNFAGLTKARKIEVIQQSIDIANQKNLEKVLKIVEKDVKNFAYNPTVTAEQLNSLVGVEGVTDDNLRDVIAELYYYYRHRFTDEPREENLEILRLAISSVNNKHKLYVEIDRIGAREDEMSERQDQFPAQEINRILGTNEAIAGYENDYFIALKKKNFHQFSLQKHTILTWQFLDDHIPFSSLSWLKKRDGFILVVREVNRKKIEENRKITTDILERIAEDVDGNSNGERVSAADYNKLPGTNGAKQENVDKYVKQLTEYEDENGKGFSELSIRDQLILIMNTVTTINSENSEAGNNDATNTQM